MTTYVVRRLLVFIPTLLAVITGVFLILRATPGSPAERILGEFATEEAIDDLEERLGLNEPIYVQYTTFLSGYLRGDFGTSLRNRRSVLSEIRRELPYTLQLAVAGMLVAVIVGLGLGILSARYPNTIVDHVCRIVGLLGISIPVFFSGLLLIYAFAVNLSWFPAIGAGDPSDPWSTLRALVLPALAVGSLSAGVTMRMTRSSMLEVLRQDYVRTAFAKGMGERVVYLKHVLRNAALPIITVVGLSFGNMLGGAVLTETVFGRPGLGKLIVDAIIWQDYPVAQASIFVFAVLFLIVNLLTDLSYALLDPRISYV